MRANLKKMIGDYEEENDRFLQILRNVPTYSGTAGAVSGIPTTDSDEQFMKSPIKAPINSPGPVNPKKGRQ